MKKLTALVLALAMIFALAACGGGQAAAPAEEPAAAPAEAAEAPAEAPAEEAPAEAPAEAADEIENPVAAEGDPVMGGEITVYWQECYNNYDPGLADNRNYALWYERLWSPDWSQSRDEYDWSSEYVTMDNMTGQLAESWEVADDFTSMTVHLRDDVKFQKLADEYDYYGGRNLTAADVAWSYNRLLGLDDVPLASAEMNWSSKLPMLESCEVVDDTTVIFHFKDASEPAINDFMIAGVCIAGPEWDELTDEQKADWHYACGTGPFMVVDYVPDSYMKFVKNPDYYMVDEAGNQLPYLDGVTLTMIPDTSNRVAQFVSGSIDILGWGNDVVNPSEKQQIRDSLPADSFYEFSYVTNPCGIFLKQCFEPFQDKNVRIAIQKAIDTETITTQYYGLDASEFDLFGIWSNSTNWSSVDQWDDELKDEFKYDPDAAKQLLADAGYPDGFEFTVVLFAMMDQDLYTLVAEQLAQVGIKMNIEVVSVPPEMQAVGADFNDPRCIPGTVCLYNLSGGIQNYASFGNNNNGALQDPVLDEICTRLMNATTMEEQTEIALEEDLYVAQQHYTIQCGPCERVNSFISGRIGGYSGERLWKNWNVTTILTNIWVNG